MGGDAPGTSQLVPIPEVETGEKQEVAEGSQSFEVNQTDEELTTKGSRLGVWGELVVVVVLVLSILYLLTFSHGRSQFARPLLWKQEGWSQPRSHVRNWVQQHLLYAAKATEDDAELIFYGDRVFELWRGTIHMEPDPRAHGAPEAFEKHFGQFYKAAVLAISGDRTPNLMWRLQNGEAPAILHSPKAIVLLIGGDDLTYAAFQGDSNLPTAGNATVARIFAISEFIRTSAPSARLLLLGLLPRGDQTLMPDRSMFTQPSKFSSTIEGVNRRLAAFAERHDQIEFLDCGQGFLESDHTALDQDLIPDAVHPSTAGLDILAECLKPAIQVAVGH